MGQYCWLFVAFLLSGNVWKDLYALRDLSESSPARKSHFESSDSDWNVNPEPSSYSSSPWQLDDQDFESLAFSSRMKRRIFGADDRLRIWSPRTRRYPFKSVVSFRLGTTNITRCSGTALTRTMFLTAAHCLFSSSGEPIRHVQVGIVLVDNTMKWTSVKDRKYHRIWKRRRRGKLVMDPRRFRFDYAVLETDSPLDVTPMKIAVVGKDKRGKEMLKSGRTIMHFSSFDDKIPSILRYRYCKMARVTLRKIYSKCDSVPETAGAGVYVFMRNVKTNKRERKVIAIETGDYSKTRSKRIGFSTALRIRRRMFVQICWWVTNNYRKCSGAEFGG